MQGKAAGRKKRPPPGLEETATREHNCYKRTRTKRSDSDFKQIGKVAANGYGTQAMLIYRVHFYYADDRT